MNGKVMLETRHELLSFFLTGRHAVGLLFAQCWRLFV